VDSAPASKPADGPAFERSKLIPQPHGGAFLPPADAARLKAKSADRLKLLLRTERDNLALLERMAATVIRGPSGENGSETVSLPSPIAPEHVRAWGEAIRGLVGLEETIRVTRMKPAPKAQDVQRPKPKRRPHAPPTSSWDPVVPAERKNTPTGSVPPKPAEPQKPQDASA